MDNQPVLRFIRVVETISHHFGFLFRRDFQLVSILFVDHTYEDWQAIIAIDECIIKIYRESGKVDLILSIPQLYDAIGQLELSDLIHGIGEAEDFSISAPASPLDEAATRVQRSAAPGQPRPEKTEIRRIC